MSALSNDKPMPSTQKASTPTEQTLASIEGLFQAVFGPYSKTAPPMNDDPTEPSG